MFFKYISFLFSVAFLVSCSSFQTSQVDCKPYKSAINNTKLDMETGNNLRKISSCQKIINDCNLLGKCENVTKECKEIINCIK